MQQPIAAPLAKPAEPAQIKSEITYDKVEEQQENYTSLTIADLWATFSQSLAADAQRSAILKQLNVQFAEHSIVITCGSEPIKSACEQLIIPNLHNFAQGKISLAAYKIDIIVKEEPKEAKPATSAEKYEFFLKQNPAIEKLKNTFNMEFE